MAFSLYHPGAASVPCEVCKKYVYNLETGQPETSIQGESGVKEVIERFGPPPCEIGGDCPKGHYSREHEFVLLERNARMYESYLDSRATNGRTLQEPIDDLTKRAFRAVDSLYRDWERHQATTQLLRIIAATR